MKTIRLTLLLWAVSLTVGAQNRDVEQAIRDFLASPGLTTSESIIRERDLSQSDNPMKSMCEVWEFTCDANMLSHIEHLSAQMTGSSSSEHCYYVKTHTPGRADWHDILVGDDPKNIVELGRSERSHYTIVNFIDTLDSTKCHRYAYALEWQEQNLPFKLKEQDGKLAKIPVTEKTFKGKVVMTYARVPKPKQNEVSVVSTDSFVDVKELKTLITRLKEAGVPDITKTLIEWIDAMVEKPFNE